MTSAKILAEVNVRRNSFEVHVWLSLVKENRHSIFH